MTFFPMSVTFHYEVMPKRLFYGSEPIQLTARFMRCTNYECVFGLGQIGSYLGAVISVASRCPLVLLNDEFPIMFGPDDWAALERWAAQRASVIIVPSADRIPQLAKELGLSDQTDKFLELRNAPKVSRPLETRDWHAVLGIPSGQRIFLNAGTLNDWGQIPEILSSTAYWPADSVLLLHSAAPEKDVYSWDLAIPERAESPLKLHAFSFRFDLVNQSYTQLP
jgi:hypothetical protein